MSAPKMSAPSEGIIYSCIHGGDTITETPVSEVLQMCDFDDEIRNALPHIERGEVCMLGGGAQPLVAVWMDTTGAGNDITDVARAFAIARGEATR